MRKVLVQQALKGSDFRIIEECSAWLEQSRPGFIKMSPFLDIAGSPNNLENTHTHTEFIHTLKLHCLPLKLSSQSSLPSVEFKLFPSDPNHLLSDHENGDPLGEPASGGHVTTVARGISPHPVASPLFLLIPIHFNPSPCCPS